MGWMFKDVEALKAVPKLSADLIKDPYYRFLNKYFLFLQIPIGLCLYAIGQKLGVGGSVSYTHLTLPTKRIV